MTIKELFAPSDMTVGKPWEKIVIFTIPMLIGNIAQQLYNTVDLSLIHILHISYRSIPVFLVMNQSGWIILFYKSSAGYKAASES